MIIIGISAYYHDSAVALIIDGIIIAAAQEERFTRIKHDPEFPSNAIKYCLKEASIELKEVDYIVFYDKPLLKFERLLETYFGFINGGFRSFAKAIPIWLKEKLFLKETLRRELSALSGLSKKELPKFLFDNHHHSHAASAFFPSPFKKAAVLCLDGVGEWATTSLWLGENNLVKPVKEIRFPHSIGLLYAAFTYYCGFKINSGEYKLMGLAPYGKPKYVDLILDNLIDLKEDGSFWMNMEYFDYPTGLTMTNKKFDKLFSGTPRQPETKISQREMDLAASIQVVTEKVVINLAKHAKKVLNVKHLCLAGGVALNCVSNGKLLRENIFDDIWIQPASGDAGGALGAALGVWYEYLDNKRTEPLTDSMQGSYLGPKYEPDKVKSELNQLGAIYTKLNDEQLTDQVSSILSEEKVVGWFQGRMEFGPRALGGRSIIGDGRSDKMQSIMNLKIKYRESFRPFAPSIKADKVSQWFDLDRPSPYMLIVADVKKDKQLEMTEEQKELFGIEQLNIARSMIPGVTHVDYSARIQTVHEETNPKFYHLLDKFEEKTKCPVLINTSFNVRGEPIVNTPSDAYRCFMRTEMDYLVIGNFLIDKASQKERIESSDWAKQFTLD